MKTCKYCGGEIMDTAKKCKHCGEWLDINCPYCDGEVSTQADKCPHCGEKLTPVLNKKKKTPSNLAGCSWVKTLLFLGFFGCLGGHRFYVGKTGTAIAMLLITLCLGWIGLGFVITLIWSFVDCIYIFVDKFTDSKGNLLVRKPTKTSTELICFFMGCSTSSFYTGKIGIGFIQLFTFGGLGIWWLIDLIMLLTGEYRDANGDKLPNA